MNAPTFVKRYFVLRPNETPYTNLFENSGAALTVACAYKKRSWEELKKEGFQIATVTFEKRGTK